MLELWGAVLKEAQEKLKERRKELSSGEQEFIQASVALRQNRRQLIYLIFGGLGVCSLLGMGFWGWWNYIPPGQLTQIRWKLADVSKRITDPNYQSKAAIAFAKGENFTLVSTQALAKLFDLFQQQVECVLLNACYSEEQADSIHQHIDCVVGMNQTIGDRVAIKFSIGFYTALLAGRNYEDSFQMGCTSIDLQGIPEYATPQIKIRRRRSAVSKKLFT